MFHVCKAEKNPLMSTFIFQVALYNTDQEGSDSPRSSLNNSLSDQSLASVNLNSVHSYTPVGWSHRNGYVQRSKQLCSFPKERFDQTELIIVVVSYSLKHTLNWILSMWCWVVFFFFFFPPGRLTMLIKMSEKEGLPDVERVLYLIFYLSRKPHEAFFREAQP